MSFLAAGSLVSLTSTNRHSSRGTAHYVGVLSSFAKVRGL